MEKLKMHTPDLADENYKKLAALFPDAVTETITGYDEKGRAIVERAIDKDVLMQEISCKVVDGNEERYQFTWPDKNKSVLLANAPINKTLRPVREDETVPTGADSEGKPYCSSGSVDFDTTENLYIEGDNLEVLKLLQETYLGKIKMIYIDPPYNTGNDFVYTDDFAQSTDEYLENSGQFDDDGNRLVKNLDSNGRFHTDWLNMIYPRLRLAKDLLSDDGVIFVSIDENEIENLKKLLAEVFGATNFIDTLHWKKKKQPSFLAKHTAKVMEYVIVYAKNANLLEKLSIESLSDVTKKVINISNSECQRHFNSGVRVKVGENGVIRKGRYTIRTMDVEYLQDVIYENGRTINDVDVVARFSVSQEKITQYIKNDLLFITSNNGLRRDVSEEEKSERKAITDLLLNEYGDNQDSDNEFRDMFDGKKYFDYTKPIKLVYNFVKSIFSQDSMVMDFFSGSATTAHAVMQLNAEDGGHRKFIMVQLPEETDEKSEAYKAGYKNICEIGKERIRRAGKKIKEETGADIDYGFRCFKVDSTNMEDVFQRPADLSQDQLSLFDSNIKQDRTPEDLLIQVMLDLGVLLSSKIEEIDIKGKRVFSVSDGYLLACFDENIDEDVVTEIAQKKPYYAVFRDSSMADDSVAANFEQIFATYSPQTVRKVL